MKALISEIKIMMHLGRHLNVVNLIGDVTENIAQSKNISIIMNSFILNKNKHFSNVFSTHL